jgi:hypothetical protein
MPQTERKGRDGKTRYTPIVTLNGSRRPFFRSVPMSRRDEAKAQFLAGLEETMNVQNAARLAGFSRRTAYRRKQEDPKFSADSCGTGTWIIRGYFSAPPGDFG